MAEKRRQRAGKPEGDRTTGKLRRRRSILQSSKPRPNNYVGPPGKTQLRRTLRESDTAIFNCPRLMLQSGERASFASLARQTERIQQLQRETASFKMSVNVVRKFQRLTMKEMKNFWKGFLSIDRTIITM